MIIGKQKEITASCLTFHFSFFLSGKTIFCHCISNLVHDRYNVGPWAWTPIIIAIMLEMDLTTLKSLSINMDDVQRRLAQHDFEPPNNPHSDSMAKIQVVAVSGCS
jgi:hypothetical protein